MPPKDNFFLTLNPFMPNGFLYLNFSDWSISNIKGAWLAFIYKTIFFLNKIPVLNANRVDPDLIPRSAESDLCLHCLPMSLLWDAMHKWVNNFV